MNKVAIIGFGAAGYNGAKEVRRLSPGAVIDIYSDRGVQNANRKGCGGAEGDAG